MAERLNMVSWWWYQKVVRVGFKAMQALCRRTAKEGWKYEEDSSRYLRVEGVGDREKEFFGVI